jgi:transcriptional regulator with XRE-family HTH domain
MSRALPEEARVADAELRAMQNGQGESSAATFGARMRAARALRGATLRQVATALGFSAAYISDIEHGNRRPPALYTVRKWAHFLGGDADALVDAAKAERKCDREYIAELEAEVARLKELLGR